MKVQVKSQVLDIVSKELQPIRGGFLVVGRDVSVTPTFSGVRYYWHGWQSWSLTAWVDSTRRLPVQKPSLLHPMQTDPLYARQQTPAGAWVGALEAPDGRILLLGALNLDARVSLKENILKGAYDSRYNDEWFVAFGPEQQVFESYAELLGERFGTGQVEQAPRVWCSWYSFYTEIDEEKLTTCLDRLGDLPFDVFQVDDGWQLKIGDWQSNAKFPSGMAALAEKIRATGRKAGLWLAPLLVVPSSKTYKNNPHWVIRDESNKPVSAGYNWNEPLYALDTTHPEVLDWLDELMHQVRTWGYDYIKLDFLYAGALPGKRRRDMPREKACREGLKAIRKSLGDAYFLTCGVPILPALGLCDGMRVGPDVANFWESERDNRLLTNYTTPGVRNAIRTSLNRLWLSPIVHTDPDVLYFRSRETTLTDRQKQMLQDLGRITGFKATSDLPEWLSNEDHAALRGFLQESNSIKRTGRSTFIIDGREVNFDSALDIPPHASLGNPSWAFVRWGSDQPWILNLVNAMEKAQVQNTLNK